MPRSPIAPHKLPAVFAVLAAVACGGAVLGETVGQSPIITRQGEQTMPSAEYRGDGFAYRPLQASQPDQYAISTPQGRYEVAQLAERGLYSQARFGGHTVIDLDAIPEMDEAVARDLAYWDSQSDPDAAYYADQSGTAEVEAEPVADEVQLEAMPVLALGD